MKSSRNVVYVGPELVFQGLTGTLVDAIDPATHKTCLHFQPESNGVRPVPCDAHDVRPHDVQIIDPNA